MKKTIKVGLAGNPNTGKTTLFNAITGKNQKTGNYPGVTVEKKEGIIEYKDYTIRVFDLPGIYSLTAYSLDEVVSRNFIIDEKPDVIIDVIDATNIERNLYLCMQFRELGVPIVGAVNIYDQAEQMGIKIDLQTLSDLLDIKLVKTIAKKREGIEELLDSVINIFNQETSAYRKVFYGHELEKEIESIKTLINSDVDFVKSYSSRWLAIKLLEKDSNAYEKINLHKNQKEIKSALLKSIVNIEKHFQTDSEVVVSEHRYSYLHGAVSESVTRSKINKIQISEQIDSILLNKYLGLPIFIFILWAIFQLTFTLGEYPMNWLESGFTWLSQFASSVLPDGILQSLIVDGIIGGVGGVLSFVPLIIILFILLSFLEDTGYIARSAFIVDKFLHIFKLHGQSFLPMILGFGCSVPAIMSSRTLRSSNDRIVTTLIIPFMSCGAKLPVYVLLAGAFFPAHEGNIVLSLYLIGVFLALITALVINKVFLKGQSTPFVMELPPYRMPTLNSIGKNTWQKTQKYLTKAGTMLLAASILIWAAVSFPKPIQEGKKYDDLSETFVKNNINEENLESLKTEYIEKYKAEEALEYSVAGRIGKFLEPIVRPIGFDWKIATSVVTGFAAKEVVVSTLGVLYRVGKDSDESSISLRQALQEDATFNPLVAYILMLFTLIIAPCIAALSAIKAEIGWKWLFFGIVYTFLLAYGLGYAIYQIGLFLNIGV